MCSMCFAKRWRQSNVSAGENEKDLGVQHFKIRSSKYKLTSFFN